MGEAPGASLKAGSERQALGKAPLKTKQLVSLGKLNTECKFLCLLHRRRATKTWVPPRPARRCPRDARL